jgi:hypothetical protein
MQSGIARASARRHAQAMRLPFRPARVAGLALAGLLAPWLRAADLPKPWPVPAALQNPWPTAWEEAYQARVRHVLEAWRGRKSGGTTFGESEKALYPAAMLAFLNGRTEEALKALQEEDNQARTDHAHTLGIDYYWCFTLKGQVRKYFYFGPHLDPDYRRRMFEAARIWTEEDPLRRPHPRHGKGDPGRGVWGPENKGSWVDVRNTDNLRAMRDIGVYLLAEETGNEATRRVYRQRLTEYVQTLHHIGMSEWDSPNYHNHALATYLNLHDFARDPEVKGLAKAALDWLCAAAALKYRHGAIGGPNARDYGGRRVFDQGASHALWLYFGDTPQPSPDPERDLVHHLTSSYRPPRAVVELARKRVAAPVELLATHPPYRNWKPGEATVPEYFETQFLGRTFQLGTCTSVSTGGLWNINAFTLVADHAGRGADMVYANTGTAVGHSWKRPGDQVAQYRQLALWLRPARPASPFQFQLPSTARTEVRDGVWFVQLERTWLAVRPMGLGPFRALSWADLAEPPKGKETERRLPREAATETIWAAETTGARYAGFALEVGEEPGSSYVEFRDAVLRRGRLDAARLEQGMARLTGVDGSTLELRHQAGTELPGVARNGVEVDWPTWRDPYGAGSVGEPPLRQAWLGGELQVSAGGWEFRSRVGTDGRAVFSERRQAGGE